MLVFLCISYLGYEKFVLKNEHSKLFLQHDVALRTKLWQPANVLEPKEYAYVPELLGLVFQKRLDIPGPVAQQLVRSADDLRIACAIYLILNTQYTTS